MNGPLSREAPQAVHSEKPSTQLARAGIVAAALFTFILALELMKTGADGARIVLQGLHVRGMANALVSCL